MLPLWHVMGTLLRSRVQRAALLALAVTAAVTESGVRRLESGALRRGGVHRGESGGLHVVQRWGKAAAVLNYLLSPSVSLSDGNNDKDVYPQFSQQQLHRVDG